MTGVEGLEDVGRRSLGELERKGEAGERSSVLPAVGLDSEPCRTSDVPSDGRGSDDLGIVDEGRKAGEVVEVEGFDPMRRERKDEQGSRVSLRWVSALSLSRVDVRRKTRERSSDFSEAVDAVHPADLESEGLGARGGDLLRGGSFGLGFLVDLQARRDDR